MTTGTVDFLLKLIEKHQEIEFKLMHNMDGGLLYYEHVKKKSIFQAGRRFEIIDNLGSLQETGYVLMNHIPVPDESKPLVEKRFYERKQMLDIVTGFQAYRFLRPVKGNMYIALTQWETKKDFERWKETDIFSEGHKVEKVKSSSYLFKNSYSAFYKMYEEEED